MVIQVLIQNKQKKIKINRELRSLWRRAAKLTINKTKIAGDRDYEVSLLLTDNEGIRQLNATYRNKDAPTDVLSFPLEEGEEEFSSFAGLADGQPLLLGDIIISMERAEEQAQSYGHSLERESAFLFIHGLLHLLGYDHENSQAEEKEMFALQEDILAFLNQMRR